MAGWTAGTSLIMLRSTAMVPPGQLAMRREAALQVLEELIDALGRLEKARRALDGPLPTSLWWQRQCPPPAALYEL